MVAEECNKSATFSQWKTYVIQTEDTSAKETETYVGICVCTIVRQAMKIKRLKKTEQYLHLNRPEPTNNNTLY